jgi:hypothetical protein
MSQKNQHDAPEEELRPSVKACVAAAQKLAENCDPALLAQLPFEVGFVTPARAKRAREIGERLSVVSS